MSPGESAATEGRQLQNLRCEETIRATKMALRAVLLWCRRAPTLSSLGPEGPRLDRVLGSTHDQKKIMCVRNMRASLAASHMHAAQIMQMHIVRWKATSCPISYISSRQTFREVMPALGKYDNRGLYRNESFRTNETCQPMFASTKTLMLAASTVCSRKTTLTNDSTLYSPRRLSPTALLVLIPPRGT